MTRNTFWTAAISILVLHASVQGAIVKNISTGIDDGTLAKIANNSFDPDFIIGLGSVAHVGETPIARSTPLPPPYFGDAVSNDSRWLALNTGVGEQGLNAIKGTYFFEMHVDLSGFSAATAQIVALRYGADDKMNEITINGISVWTRPIAFGGDLNAWHPIGSLGMGAFTTGLNTIRFNVSNEPDPPTAMALRLEGRVEAAAVPEPTASVLAAVAAVMLGVCQAARQRKSAGKP